MLHVVKYMVTYTGIVYELLVILQLRPICSLKRPSPVLVKMTVKIRWISSIYIG